MTVQDIPLINASLNSIAMVLLLFGRWAIKKQNRKLHIRFMVSALVVSAFFLAFYLFYHYHHGSTKYQGEGILRVVYFAILLTHIPLAGLIVPFIIAAVWQAAKGRFDQHVKIVKWLWPVWMYVSVTGVLIYLMLKSSYS